MSCIEWMDSDLWGLLLDFIFLLCFKLMQRAKILFIAILNSSHLEFLLHIFAQCFSVWIAQWSGDTTRYATSKTPFLWWSYFAIVCKSSDWHIVPLSLSRKKVILVSLLNMHTASEISVKINSMNQHCWTQIDIL